MLMEVQLENLLERLLRQALPYDFLPSPEVQLRRGGIMCSRNYSRTRLVNGQLVEYVGLARGFPASSELVEVVRAFGAMDCQLWRHDHNVRGRRYLLYMASLSHLASSERMFHYTVNRLRVRFNISPSQPFSLGYRRISKSKEEKTIVTSIKDDIPFDTLPQKEGKRVSLPTEFVEGKKDANGKPTREARTRNYHQTSGGGNEIFGFLRAPDNDAGKASIKSAQEVLKENDIANQVLVYTGKGGYRVLYVRKDEKLNNGSLQKAIPAVASKLKIKPTSESFTV